MTCPTRAALKRYTTLQETPGYTDIGYANQGLMNAPTAAYAARWSYYTEGLPAQIAAGQRASVNLPVQGAILPYTTGIERAVAGPAAPTDLGRADAGPFAPVSAPWVKPLAPQGLAHCPRVYKG
jgi:hypothetical protein